MLFKNKCAAALYIYSSSKLIVLSFFGHYVIFPSILSYLRKTVRNKFAVNSIICLYY